MGERGFGIRIEESLQLVDPVSGRLCGIVCVGDTPDTAAAGEPAERASSSAGRFWDRVEQAARALAIGRARAASQALSSGLAIAVAGLNPVHPGLPARPARDPASAERQRGSEPTVGAAVEPRTGGGPEGTGRRASEPTADAAVEPAADDVFGTCIQITLPDPAMAVHITGGMAPYIPHLLALSASSPFHAGADTRFDSFRTILRDRSPRAGLPPALTSATEYDAVVDVLEPGRASLYRPPVDWDIRPAPEVGGVEFRCLDACPRLDDISALAACARALALMLSDRTPPQPAGLDVQLWRVNRWRAARFGLDARLYRLSPPTGGEWGARHAIRWLLERLAPLADRLGDGAALSGAERILERGNVANAMREVHRREGSPAAVARWLIEETVVGHGTRTPGPHDPSGVTDRTHPSA